MRCLIILFFLTKLLSGYCQEEDVKIWSLEQCIDSALIRNYNIRSENIKAEVQSLYLKNSKYSYLPTINAGTTLGYNWGQTIDPFTNEFATSRVQYNNLYLNSSLVLFSGLQNYYSQKVIEIDWKSQQYNKLIVARNLKFEVTTRYLQVLLNKEVLNIAKEHLELTLKQKENLNELIKAKRKPKNAILEVLAQEETEKYNVLKAKNDLNYSILLLQQLLNKKYDSSFDVKEIKVNPIKEVRNNELSFTNSSSPDLKVATLNIKKQELNIKSTKGKLSPMLSLNGSLGSGYSGNNKYLAPSGNFTPKSFKNQLNENFYQSASLTLSIPIFNKNTTKTQVKIQQIKINELLLAKEKQALNLSGKIERLKMDVKNANAQYNSQVKVLKAYKTNYENSKIQLENGAINFIRFLEVKEKLFKVQSQLSQSKYRLLASQIILQLFFQG